MEKENLLIKIGESSNTATKIKNDKQIPLNTVRERIDKVLFEKDLRVLTKEQISTFLASNDKKLKKSELVKVALDTIYGNELLMIKFYKEFRDILAVMPYEVEAMLDCTTIERKRWTDEKLLEALEYRKCEKYGRALEYPVFDRLQIYSISKYDVECWKSEYERVKKVNKAIACKKAAETKRINDNIRADFKKELKRLLIKWYRIGERLGATFELAYWTVWISRWAKEYQEKAYEAIKNKDKYFEQKKYLYQLKNNAIKLLLESDYAYQSFYRPENHNKETFDLCDYHYEEYRDSRNLLGTSIWTYFEKYREEILNCPCCNYNSGDDYYSLFHLEISHKKIKDYKFSFYTPYGLGKDTFRDKDELPRVLYDENEGLFRFERSLFEEEKGIYKEKDVVKKFLAAVEKYKMCYGL